MQYTPTVLKEFDIGNLCECIYKIVPCAQQIIYHQYMSDSSA